MTKPIRRLAAPLAIAGLIVGLAHPVLAGNQAFESETQSSSVPMLFDVLVMRPMGLAATVMGTAFYLFPVAPIMALDPARRHRQADPAADRGARALHLQRPDRPSSLGRPQRLKSTCISSMPVMKLEFR